MTTPPSYISGTEISGGFTYSAGESVEIISGGQAYDMTMNSGGYEYVDVGGRATATTINVSGYVYLSGGTAYNTVIYKGGEQDVAAGTASGTKIESGGVNSVYSGGKSSATSVYAGGSQDVGSGGREYTTTDAGVDHVYSGGKSYNGQVQNGGVQFVTLGGIASNTTVASGGSAILAGDTLYHDTFYAKSGSLVVSGVYKNGTETITLTGKNLPYEKIIGNATTQEYYTSAGALLLKVMRQGNEVYDTFYTSTGSTTTSHTSKQYKAGGIASGMVVQSGGSIVLDGGTAKSLTVQSGGTENVGGNVSLTSAGAQYDFYISAITVRNSQIANGVTQIVNAHDKTVDTVVNSGGTQTVTSTGTADATTINGGTLNLLSGAKTTGKIAFTGTDGSLVISAGTAATLPRTVISGFAATDKIKLAGIAYVSGASAAVTSAGVVTITDGGKNYHLNIAGATIGENFVFNAGSVLTLGAAEMSFLKPEPISATLADWSTPVQAPQTMSAATIPSFASATTSYAVAQHNPFQKAETPLADISRHLVPPH